MTNTPDTEWLRRRLDAMILLLMEAKANEPLSNAARIEKLQTLGFKPSESAKIINKDISFVTATLANKKRSRAKAKKKKAVPAAVASTPESAAENAT